MIDVDVLEDAQAAGDPAQLDPVAMLALAQSEVEPRAVMALVASGTEHLVDPGEIGAGDFDLGRRARPVVSVEFRPPSLRSSAWLGV